MNFIIKKLAQFVLKNEFLLKPNDNSRVCSNANTLLWTFQITSHINSNKNTFEKYKV
jgi:hypothetical protein